MPFRNLLYDPQKKLFYSPWKISLNILLSREKKQLLILNTLCYKIAPSIKLNCCVYAFEIKIFLSFTFIHLHRLLRFSLSLSSGSSSSLLAWNCEKKLCTSETDEILKIRKRWLAKNPFQIYGGVESENTIYYWKKGRAANIKLRRLQFDPSQSANDSSEKSRNAHKVTSAQDNHKKSFFFTLVREIFFAASRARHSIENKQKINKKNIFGDQRESPYAMRDEAIDNQF